MNIFNEYKELTIEKIYDLLEQAYEDETKLDKILEEIADEVFADLEKILRKLEKDGKIDLNVVRTEKFENNYKSINNFSDGKNIDRIYEKLIKKKII